MHALERVHRSLAAGGLLLDMHPIPPAARAVDADGELGVFDEDEFLATVHATEAGLEEVVRRGLFVADGELSFESRETFDTAAELLEAVAEWEGFRVPRTLKRRLRRAGAPIDVRHTVVLRRFRVIR